MSPKEQNPRVVVDVDDDEPDEWDKRIFSTGCSVEQDKMNDCYFAKKDWRACKKEVRWFPIPCIPTPTPNTTHYRRNHYMRVSPCGLPHIEIYLDPDLMEAFRECWKRKGNDDRTQTKDA
ncbi:hypothetical protein P875_00042400 [Aspergillus parasiticus SU-1]|uniref:Uncharacterized protein n=1 Tax=Aspergillus parasiticus (strain ATCC 56775 / NRRL 5862 / SRRC 143 / SU-1) TaxID=1403190 RepID=A0A0F0I2F0_ASPPU|nr:hypothetical protein P875_00042400 [Aspergillus parasiticus SU-1]